MAKGERLTCHHLHPDELLQQYLPVSDLCSPTNKKAKDWISEDWCTAEDTGNMDSLV